jgi:hypothetical protein
MQPIRCKLETRTVAVRNLCGSTLHSLLLALLLPAPALAQTTTRVNVDSSGAEANDASEMEALSADGRIVVFTSLATNLVLNDTNGVQDLVIHDRQTGTTECISVDPSGDPGNDASCIYDLPSVSADGRFVSFASFATNLVAGRTTSDSQIFVRDRATGITEIVSVDPSGVEANQGCYTQALSADGGIVAFASSATNLVAGDKNGNWDVFVRDRATGITELVSISSAGVQGDDGSFEPRLSADGMSVAFNSFASNLIPNDKNKRADAFVHDRRTGTTERISITTSGVEGDRDSVSTALSADGRVVLFYSSATNLVPNDTNGLLDAFVHDRTTGVTERVSVDSSGAEANGTSVGAWLSADGSVVGFGSDAPNLVAGDTNGASDAFVHDRSSGITTRMSLTSTGTEANGDSGGSWLTADGRAVVFESYATNVVSGDTNGTVDLFVRDFHVSTWSNYGSGFPGTNGIPSFTSSANPVIGTTITLTLENSFQQPTVGLAFAGIQRASVHSSWGGDLLVDPIVVLPITFSFGFDQFDWSIPNDFGLLGVTVDLQALEADPGAMKGVSFTAGLELVVGI